MEAEERSGNCSFNILITASNFFQRWDKNIVLQTLFLFVRRPEEEGGMPNQTEAAAKTAAVLQTRYEKQENICS
ncbi:hypothetical protein [Geobacter lovleyi]|uniref:Uncharacterized protein n=1 Tax=Trichlorobacter lovleyi (strain ATCC BAA-1151 / DSM 17278 / SZ) TaxID=398767 RepID=B3E7B7_TRIL1|nr:hypothetical protein Glov_2721 [Trichlorobacter lovleyi SZ]